MALGEIQPLIDWAEALASRGFVQARQVLELIEDHERLKAYIVDNLIVGESYGKTETETQEDENGPTLKDRPNEDWEYS